MSTMNNHLIQSKKKKIKQYNQLLILPRAFRLNKFHCELETKKNP